MFATPFEAGYLNAFLYSHSPNQMPEIQKIFPNSRLEMLNTGHLVHAEAPDEVMKLILDFINT